MDIIISNSDEQPIYEQITSQIKSKIMAGELVQGDVLPSMRLLAKELRISVITTKRAYEELERDGYIVSITGRGSFVAAVDQALMRSEQAKRAEALMNKLVLLSRESDFTLDDLKDMLTYIYNRDTLKHGKE